MAEDNSVDPRKLQQWVVSLAVTVVCCAVFFFFFAAYFLDTQQKLIETQVRAEMLESRLTAVENNVRWNIVPVLTRAHHQAPSGVALDKEEAAPAKPQGAEEHLPMSKGLMLNTTPVMPAAPAKPAPAQEEAKP